MVHDSDSHKEGLIRALVGFSDFDHPVNHSCSQRSRDVMSEKAVLGNSFKLFESKRIKMLKK